MDPDRASYADDDCGKVEGEEILLSPGTPAADVVYSYPGGGSRSRMTVDAVMALLVLGPDAPSAAATDSVTCTYPDVPMDLLRSSEMNHSFPAPAPATRRSGAPSPAGGPPVIGESHTDMLTADFNSDSDMSPAAWNSVAYPATASAAIYGAATAYPGPGGINLNVITAGPDTNAAAGFGYGGIDAYQGAVADLRSGRLHPTGAAANATERGGGYYYYNNNNSYYSGMALPSFAAQVGGDAGSDGLVVAHADEVPGAVAELVRGGGLGGLGLIATSLATAGLIAGGVETPATAIVLFGMLIAGVILVTVRVLRA